MPGKHFICSLTAGILSGAALLGPLTAAEPPQIHDVEKVTPSGMRITFQAGNWNITREYEYLRYWERELTRLFLPPPGGCRIFVSREVSSGEILTRTRDGQREIVLGKGFITCADNPEYYASLAEKFLVLRFGLADTHEALPAWIRLGLEAVYGFREKNDKTIPRTQNYFPVLRMVLSCNIKPDFRALMQCKEILLQGSGRDTAMEFSRFLLEIFARLSDSRNRAFGNYTAGMLKGGRQEKEIFNVTLLPVLRSPRSAESGNELLCSLAEAAAFNHRFPCRAADLRQSLAEVLIYRVPGNDKLKEAKGSAEDLPKLFKTKDPRAESARRQIQEKLEKYTRTFSPENLGAAWELKNELAKVSGEDPEEESAAIRRSVTLLLKRLAEQEKVETYLENAERQYIPVCIRLWNVRQEAARNEEFLTAAEQKFLLETEERYLEK